jgi:hypothetical protein
MRPVLAFLLVSSLSAAAWAGPAQDALDKRVTAISRASKLNSTQTQSLRKYTREFESELDVLLEKYREPRMRAPFTKALVARFRNKLRILMTPSQFARFEALEGRS